MRNALAPLVALAALAAVANPVVAKDKTKGEWGKDIPYFTESEPAIKEAKATGKILLIYNGWERDKI